MTAAQDLLEEERLQHQAAEAERQAYYQAMAQEQAQPTSSQPEGVGRLQLPQEAGSPAVPVRKSVAAYDGANAAADATDDAQDTADGPSSQRITGAVMEPAGASRGRPQFQTVEPVSREGEIGSQEALNLAMTDQTDKPFDTKEATAPTAVKRAVALPGHPSSDS